VVSRQIDRQPGQFIVNVAADGSITRRCMGDVNDGS
jgi:hypothetical protein